MMKKTGLLVGLVSGVIIGSTVGLAIAPRSGKETRQDLKHRIGKVRDRLAKKRADSRLNSMGDSQARKADYVH